ncbi:organic cation transporter protein-like isoform X2 [Bombyx mandarina]|nr:organic cation transporter protein-like isoform X2 [Bombyx mandarina]
MSTAENPTWWPNKTIDRCYRPVLKDDYGTCNSSSFTDSLVQCTEWIYESNNTVVAELNLGCQPWRSNLIGTIHSFGMMTSMFVTGWIYDVWGRKPALVICIVGSAVGVLKVLVKNWYIYVMVEFLEACMSGGTYTSGMVLMLEICGKDKRLLAGVLFSYFIYFGETLFACMAMVIPYWKTMILIIYSPLILFLSFIWLIKESPRWQIVKGKTEEAKNTMILMAKTNKINMDMNELSNIDGVGLRQKFDIKENEKEGFHVIFKSPEILKRVFVACFCRFSASFVYYGLMLNSVWLPGDKYINFLLITIMSYPGELISLYFMKNIGRKLSLIIGFILTAALCFCSAQVPETYLWTKISLFLVGKMLISGCFTGVITYSMELFPTSVRGLLLGLGALTSRIGNMMAPLTPMLMTFSPSIPSIFFGCAAVMSGLLIILTPETRDQPLMDTVRQVEESVLKEKQVNSVATAM